MAVKFYKCAPFDHAQENKAFEDLYFAAKDDLDEKGDVRVIGNIKCRGWPQIDTLVISPHSITIVDYKDYGGEIQLTEDGPWFTRERIQVLGGSYANPFQQVKTYKHSLRALNNTYELFPYINDTHITGLVIFTRKVCVDNRLSGIITKWFQAGNFEDGMAFLRHTTSKEISISSDCMDRITERLNAKPFVAPTRLTGKTSPENKPEAPALPILPSLTPLPPSPSPVWPWAMIAGVALCIAPAVGYFAWQHSARPDPNIPETVSSPATAASLGAKEAPRDIVNVIPTNQAHMYVGQHKIVCGQIVELKEIKAGLFINFDNSHPNEVMSAIIWRKNIDNINTIKLKENQSVCISGLIETYRGKPQMEIDQQEQIVR